MIQDRTLNRISIVVGVLLTAYIANNLHTNPRWYGDNGPGVGLMPRGVVTGFMDVAYKEGQLKKANELYVSPKSVDVTPNAAFRIDGTPLNSTVRQVVAEGLNVAIHHCVEAAAEQPAAELVDMFRTNNGRIIWRKTIVQPLAEGVTCATSELAKPVELGQRPAAQ